MKWKNALTAEEAALVVTGFNVNDSIYDLESSIVNNTSRYEYKHLDISTSINEAIEIFEAFSNESQRSWQGYESTLEVYLSNPPDFLDTMFTKNSWAQWLYEAGDLNKAKILNPEIASESTNGTKERPKGSNQSSIIKPYKELAHWFTHESLTITELSFLFMRVQPDTFKPESIRKSTMDEASKFISMEALLIKAVGNGKLRGSITLRDKETGTLTSTLYEATSISNNGITPCKTLIDLTDLAEYLSPKKAAYGEFYDYINSHAIVDEDKERHSLIAENEQLKKRIKELESQQLYKLNEHSLNSKPKQNIEPSLSEYLPVNGKDMKTLSKAFQNFPTRFEYYKKVSPTKKLVSEWLSSSFECNTREQDVFADLLTQNFKCSD